MSQSLENALIDPDDHAACRTLHEFLCKDSIPKSPHPATAKAYLEAFCDPRRPVVRRRWTGLVLARLLESCLDVVHHWKRDPDDLVRIGAVILGLHEAEETRIVAGLIIRAGLSQGIQFSDFWSERKIHATATFFPNNVDAFWMKGFQDYMDTLSELSFPNSSPQLMLLYPVALISEDGYRWSPDSESLPILLIESHTLTIITPASTAQEIDFVYIPLGSIKNVRCQPSNPYDSQGGVAPAAPWAVVLEFLSIPTPYKVNCSEHPGRIFTIVMETDADAKDCVRCINDVRRPKGSLSDIKNTSSPAFNGDLGEGKVIKGDAQTLSQGDVVVFDRSQREGSFTQGSQQAHQAASKAVHGPRIESAQAKRGTLVKVKKTLHSSRVKSVLEFTHTGLEFPAHSPLAERPTKASPKTLSTRGAGNTAWQISAAKSTARASAASKSNIKRQELIELHDDDHQPNINDEDVSKFKKSQLEAKGPECMGKPNASMSSQNQVGRSCRRQSQEMQADEESARRGSKRTRARVMTYKEDTSSGDDSSDSDFADRGRTKKTRPLLVKTMSRKESSLPSPTISARSSRITKKNKPSIRTLQPREGSLLSNLQLTTGARGGQNNRRFKTGTDLRSIHQPPAAAPPKPKREAANASRKEGPSSEAHILGKLNDSESNVEPGSSGDHTSNTKDDAASRKRTSGSITPSTPRAKRAKVNRGGTVIDAEIGEPMSMKPPLTVAPLRVLEDASSPCDSRKGKSMQAPPKPVVEEAIRVASPKTDQRSVHSQKQFDERQTPIHQLGKRSHSCMSNNLELLSSNSKPTPASPRAASTAISGHADRYQVSMEQAQGEYEIERNDPFQMNCRKINEFTRRLTGSRGVSQESEPTEGFSQDHPIELGDSSSSSSSEALPSIKQSPATSNGHAGMSEPIGVLRIRAPESARRSRSRTIEKRMAEPLQPEAFLGKPGHQDRQQNIEDCCAGDAELDGDTLVDLEELQQDRNVSLMHLRSSPPPMDHSPSSHSSTSAELEPKTDPPVPTSQADEMEWEASLQPYQRDLKDQLLRVSNRVLQHIIDNESAVNDIADTFAKDGQHSLNLLINSHEQEFDAMDKDVKQKQAKMSKATGKVLLKLRKERLKTEDDNE